MMTLTSAPTGATAAVGGAGCILWNGDQCRGRRDALPPKGGTRALPRRRCWPAARGAAHGPGPPARLRARSVLHYKSVLYEGFCYGRAGRLTVKNGGFVGQSIGPRGGVAEPVNGRDMVVAALGRAAGEVRPAPSF
jgi:hypothetical protein